MSDRRIPIEPNCKVVVNAHKHADFTSHDLPEVLITGRGAAGTVMDFQQEENTLHLEMFKEGTIGLPLESYATIQAVEGHAKVRQLPQGLNGKHIGGHFQVLDSGPIQIEHVGGHAELRAIEGSVDLEHVGGHLKVGPCTGNVSAQHVGGHAELVDIDGTCNLPKVGGHSKLIGVSGGQNVDAGGNVNTQLELLPDLSYEIKAGGLLTCDLPPLANATIHMNGPAIGPFFSPTRVFGDGSVQVHLQAGGPITLTENGIGNHEEDVKRGIWETVRAAKVMAKAKVKKVLDENNITPETTADLQEQFSEIAEVAVEVAKEFSEEVQEKAKQVWNQRGTEQGTSGEAAEQDSPASTDLMAAEAEERKMILRMLSENKITVEEANDLLTALNK